QFARLGETGKTMISLVLPPGLPRSAGYPHVLPVPAGVTSALLLLKTRGGPYTSYSGSLETPEGRQVLKSEGLKSWAAGDGRIVPIPLPSAALQRGDYILRLKGHAGDKSEEVDVYSFRVVAH
ncbi:MAG: hypothetical protein C5B54_06285, partial [Acidobacteria bacterium]